MKGGGKGKGEYVPSATPVLVVQAQGVVGKGKGAPSWGGESEGGWGGQNRPSWEGGWTDWSSWDGSWQGWGPEPHWWSTWGKAGNVKKRMAPGGKAGAASKIPKPSNPGLDPEKPTFTGKMKSRMNVKSGYCFIICEEISLMFPGKDTFLHGKMCPWADYMDLEPGDEVKFQIEDRDGSPQCTRVVKIASAGEEGEATAPLPDAALPAESRSAGPAEIPP